jgi:hypothetical protein
VGKILLKILNFFRKLKKKKYSLEPLLRIYEEIAEHEYEVKKKDNIQYVCIPEPREYYLESKPQPPERKLQFYSGIEWM